VYPYYLWEGKERIRKEESTSSASMVAMPLVTSQVSATKKGKS